MRSPMARLNPIEVLVAARRVADFAASDGVDANSSAARYCYDHLGAVLADSVLQAGLNYRSVVRPRVARILVEFSQADSTDALLAIVESGEVGAFLDWQHPTKISRFERLVFSVHESGVKDADDLKHRLADDHFCDALQSLNGIGPKTVDYMACLVGIESVAVDRHIRSYAKRAGVETTDYQHLKRVFCIAADLLAVSRRAFDAWIWRRESKSDPIQLSLNFAEPTDCHSGKVRVATSE